MAQMNNTSNASTLGPCSVYIPSIHRGTMDYMLDSIVSRIGKISRVDYVELTPPKKHFHSVFIHFDAGDDSFIGTDGCPVVYYVDMYGKTTAYKCVLLKAHNPVPVTQLNIHQIANNLKVLEESLWGSINRKDEQICDLEEMVIAQQEQLKNQGVMIRLLQQQVTEMKVNGGFITPMHSQVPSQIPSPPVLRRQSNAPYPQFFSDDEPCINLNNRFDAAVDDEESVSTHDSMPSLVSASTADSMPPLIDISKMPGMVQDSWDNYDYCGLPVVYNSSV